MEFRAVFDARQALPGVTRERWRAFDRVVLVVDPEDECFRDGRLVAIARWIAGEFDGCVVLVGDVSHRFRLIEQRRTTPEVALRDAMAIGREYVATHARALQRVGGCRFDVTTCSLLQTHRFYAQTALQIASLRSWDPSFQDAFRESIDFGSQERGGGEPREGQLREERLEEAAAIAAVAAEVYSPVFVQPGPELPIYRAIASGRIQGVPDGLRSRLCVPVRLDTR